MPAKKYLAIDSSGNQAEVAATVVSSGVASDGNLPALDATGKLDSSVIPTIAGSVGSENYYVAEDHYFQHQVPASVPFGQLGLVVVNSGTTSTIITSFNATNVGIIALDTGTGATNNGLFRTNIGGFRFGGGAGYNLRLIVRLPDLPSAAQTYSSVIGFADANVGSGAVSDGAYFFASLASPNWQVITISNSVSTGTVTTTSVAIDTNFNTFDIDVNKAGTTVTYSINGVVVGTHSANIPNVTGRETGIQISIAKTVGTVQRQIQLDYSRFIRDARP